MPYILSPEQKVVADAIRANTTSTDIKYFDIKTAIQAICTGILGPLKESKKILIHLPPSANDVDTKAILLQNGLEELTIDLRDKTAIPETDTIKLRTAIKKNIEAEPIIKNVLAERRLSTAKEKIDAYYQKFDQRILSDISIRDFIAKIIYSPAQQQFKATIPKCDDLVFDFSLSEYYSLKKDVENAIQLYRKEFELYGHLSLFREQVWKDLSVDKINFIKSTIQDLRKENKEILDEFEIASEELKTAASKSLNATFDQLLDRIHSHEEACLSFHIKNEIEISPEETGFSLFKQKSKAPANTIFISAFDEITGLIKNISADWFSELDSPVSDEITFEYISKFLNKAKSSVFTHRKQLNSILQKSVQRINKINTTSERVKVLDQKLKLFSDKVNQVELFTFQVDQNILSFKKQQELCSNIYEYINKCHALINGDDSYLQWQSHISKSKPIFKVAFQSFKKQPKQKWLECFEAWYNGQLLHEVSSPSDQDFEQIGHFHQTGLAYVDSEVQAVISKLHRSRIESSLALKNKSKEVYNILFKKNQLPTNSWTDLALLNRPFLQNFFPIHLSQSLAHHSDYDIIISFSKREDQDPNFLPEKAHFISPILSTDIENLSESNSLFLYLNHYEYDSILDELSSTEKLKASKKLAKFILSLNQEVKIHQLKSANIISLLPTYDSIFLEKHLESAGLKTIDTNDALYDRLTESLLFTNRKPFMIIKDNLINPELYDHALWQQHILQIFQKAGYTIISVSTMKQLTDNANIFSNIQMQIMGNDVEAIIEKEENEQLEVQAIESLPIE